MAGSVSWKKRLVGAKASALGNWLELVFHKVQVFLRNEPAGVSAGSAEDSLVAWPMKRSKRQQAAGRTASADVSFVELLRLAICAV